MDFLELPLSKKVILSINKTKYSISGTVEMP